MFGKTLMYRKEQNRLMNAVYDHFTKDESKDLMIEAATGMGKTIGYLLPLSYLATPEKPAVISTVSLVLQQQINGKRHSITESITRTADTTCDYQKLSPLY
mgnify:CR=1 FL=1